MLVSAIHQHESAISIHMSRLARWLSGKEPACKAGDPGSSWVGKIPWRREKLHTPVLWPEESLDCIDHGVAKSQIQLSDFHFQALFEVKPSISFKRLVQYFKNNFIYFV